MGFIQLTHKTGRGLVVDTAAIVAVIPTSDTGSRIILRSDIGSVECRELPGDVAKLLIPSDAEPTAPEPAMPAVTITKADDDKAKK